MSFCYDRSRPDFFENCVEHQTFPRNDALKLIVLEEILDDFEVGETYSKSKVNEKIQQYFDEYVMIRREFVNFRYVQYDNTENEYTVMKNELSEDDAREISRLERHARDIGVLD